MNDNLRVELKQIVSRIKNTFITFMLGTLPVNEMGYDKDGIPVEELVANAKQSLKDSTTVERFARDKKTGRFVSKKR